MEQAEPLTIEDIRERETQAFIKERAEFFEEHSGEDAPELWIAHLEGSVIQARIMGTMGILTAADIRDEYEAATGGKYSAKYGMLLDEN